MTYGHLIIIIIPNYCDQTDGYNICDPQILTIYLDKMMKKENGNDVSKAFEEIIKYAIKISHDQLKFSTHG